MAIRLNELVDFTSHLQPSLILYKPPGTPQEHWEVQPLRFLADHAVREPKLRAKALAAHARLQIAFGQSADICNYSTTVIFDTIEGDPLDHAVCLLNTEWAAIDDTFTPPLIRSRRLEFDADGRQEVVIELTADRISANRYSASGSFDLLLDPPVNPASASSTIAVSL